MQGYKAVAKKPSSIGERFLRYGRVTTPNFTFLHLRRQKQPVCLANLTENKSNTYNKDMKLQMGWDNLNPYEYHFERGLYYHEIHPNVICGTQPTKPEDINYLKHEEKVTTLLSLQQDKDLQYWGVNLDAIKHRCQQEGVVLLRQPARDFDPHSLRRTLPSAVHSLHRALERNERVYVHCTAGLGRSPAVIIAYLYWFQNMSLEGAYSHLTAIRPCGPNKEAIRGATYDLVRAEDFNAFFNLPKDAFLQLGQDERRRLQERVIRNV